MSAEVFVQVTTYDALNRMSTLDNWHLQGDTHAARYVPSYNERGLLFTESLTMRSGDPNPTPEVAIQKVLYNEKGQKTALVLGSGTLTQYDYDLQTFRLKQIQTTRPADSSGFPGRRSNLKDPAIVQQLLYTYDPVGNITEVEDQAYEPVFFQNQILEPHCRYEYDALYRLISASGRESAQGGNAARDGADPAFASGFHVTDQTLRIYTQTYQYDSVGNFITMAHAVNGDTAAGWTRHYETFPDSNRLHYTWTGSDRVATQIEYRYDTHGSMLNFMNSAPGQDLRWDYRDMIASIDMQGGGRAFYQYDAGKQRTRKYLDHGILEERIYLSGYELYRKTIAGKLAEEIESHHLFAGEQRVLLVEDFIPIDKTQPAYAPLFRYQYSNHLDSACLELRDDAAILSYEEFHPFGATAYRAGNANIEVPPKRYRYTGMERDEESGLNYHRARYYASFLGCWISCDPKTIVDGPNLYAYCKNRPSLLTDVQGMQTPPPQLELIQQTELRQPATATAAGPGFSQDLRQTFGSLGRQWGMGKIDVGHPENQPFATTPAGATTSVYAQDASENRSLGSTADKAAVANAKANKQFVRIDGVDPNAVKGTRYGQPPRQPKLQNVRVNDPNQIAFDFEWKQPTSQPDSTQQLELDFSQAAAPSELAAPPQPQASPVAPEAPTPNTLNTENLAETLSTSQDKVAVGSKNVTATAKADSAGLSVVAKEVATGLSEVAAGAGKILTFYGALKVGNDVTTELRNAGSPFVTSALYGAVATTLSVPAGAVDDAALLTPVGSVVLESWSNNGAGSAQVAVGEALFSLGMLGLTTDKHLGLK